MRRFLVSGLILSTLLTSVGLTYFKAADPGEPMTAAANAFINSLDAEQQKTAVMPYEAEVRVDWHFIPKDERKGLQLKHMSEAQQTAALDLLKTALSEAGYTKARKIMQLETLLNEFEAGKGRWIRDNERYYYTIFGDPSKDGRWGLSFEGHHLSLNFVVENGRIIESSPQFFATNPAIVKDQNNSGIEVGTRVLKVEETLAFELVNSLSDEQKQSAIIADTAPKEIREAGSPQPPAAAKEGITYRQLDGNQRRLLLQLIDEYCKAMPDKIAAQRMNRLHYDGLNDIYFAWAGALEEGIGHYYRIETPSSLIEFVNTQPDPKGNPANHIHCVYRDMHGDFALPAK